MIPHVRLPMIMQKLYEALHELAGRICGCQATTSALVGTAVLRITPNTLFKDQQHCLGDRHAEPHSQRKTPKFKIKLIRSKGKIQTSWASRADILHKVCHCQTHRPTHRMAHRLQEVDEQVVGDIFHGILLARPCLR